MHIISAIKVENVFQLLGFHGRKTYISAEFKINAYTSKFYIKKKSAPSQQK